MSDNPEESYYDDAISARTMSVVDAETGGIDVGQPCFSGDNWERSPEDDLTHSDKQALKTHALESDGSDKKSDHECDESVDCLKVKVNQPGQGNNEAEPLEDSLMEAMTANISKFTDEQVYSFAKDVEVLSTSPASVSVDEDPRTVEFVLDSHGYSHVKKLDHETKQSQAQKIDKDGTDQHLSNAQNANLGKVFEMAMKLGSSVHQTPTDPRAEHIFGAKDFRTSRGDDTHLNQENVYETVPLSSSRDGSVSSLQASGIYEVVGTPDSTIISKDKSNKSKRSKRKVGSRRSYPPADGKYNLKRRQEKSKALKRSSKLEMPVATAGEKPADGNIYVDVFDSSSDGSYFTDSSFDSVSSAEECVVERLPSYSQKPLPAVPKHKRDFKQMLLNTQTEVVEEESILQPVMLQRARPPPSLPDGPRDLTQTQIKLRGVLQSLVDSETGYINSLDRLANEYHDAIVNQFGIKKQEVKVTFSQIKEIHQVHRMFQIELADKLEKWNATESIGEIFHMFSQHMVIDFYSEYVNNYEAACEHMKECENSKQAFKDFLRSKQMSSLDRLSLQGLMLKPIQRFPQFIMIIKDLLKNTPREHHDREPLQEALTGIENVAHQLNERKRESEQQHHGQTIISRLSPRLQFEKNVCLIRQDDMEQISQECTEKVRVFLCDQYLIVGECLSCVYGRESDNGEREKLTYKWHAPLQNVQLTTSAITPNMQTKVQKEASNTTILSPRIDDASEDPYNVASDLTDMMHDISVLAQISQLVASLKYTYPGLTEDNLHETVTKLQKDIQGKDYQLQMLNSSTIILQDTVRKKKYVFSAANANVKQEWCIDFLMAKYALDTVNIPSWYKQEGEAQHHQPALLMKPMSVDMQRTFTRVKCATKVYFPTKNEGSVEHLWVCSSTDQLGQVSIVSLHTAKPALVESFQATTSEILCVEMVEGFGEAEDEMSFKDDTVWMSTADSKIYVFMMSESQSGSHRRPVHTFDPGCLILSMHYVEDHMFCGSKSGLVLVYTRDDAGQWSSPSRMTLGPGPVTSLICVGFNLWAACGSKIYIYDVEHKTPQGIIDGSAAHSADARIQYLVKTGVGVWVSYMGQPNISLYHSESKKLLQDFSITKALNEFLTAYSEDKENPKAYNVTSLMASLGLLWIGTNVGIILTYPLPRLRDGVPRINNRPSVALHGHNEPVKFLVPVQYGPVSGNPIRRRPSSILRKNVTGSVLHKLHRVDEKTQSMELKAEAEHSSMCDDKERMYEKIRTVPDSPRIYATCTPQRDPDSPTEDNSKPDSEKDKFLESDEHKYFILKPLQRDTSEQSISDASERKVGDLLDSVPEQNGETVMMRNSHGSRRGGQGQDEIKDKRLSIIETDKCRVGQLPQRPTTMVSHLSFRSELRKKVRNRMSCDDLIDRDITRDQVDQLYPTLLRAKPLDMKQSTEGYYTLPNVSSKTDTQQSSTTPSPSSPSMSRKSSTFSLMKSKKLSEKGPPRKSSSPSRKVEISPDTKMAASQKQTGLNRKSSIGSSFAGGSGIDTMRRQDSNTILVLSGGDGYRDWKKGRSPHSYRPEEPCLLFWMYRF